MTNRFVHLELNTDDVGKAAGFYKKLFKWKMTPMKGMPYTMIDTGSKESGAGLQKKPMPEVPTMWLPYVEVDSVKKTVAKAQRLGATIHLEFMPIPGQGAMGIFSDPTGASIGVWEAEKKPAKKAGSKRK
jgi:predicted enzyme related to lactoylglutathione lyase